jgi:hypothetical protein
MKNRFAAGLALALGAAYSAAAWAQAVASDVPPAAAVHKVAANTLVDLEIAQPISTRTIKRGDMFAIRLAAPITLDGSVLVPAGATGQGQVVDAGKAGLGGKPAKLVLAARYLDWNGQRIPLHGFRWGRIGTGADRQTEANTLALVPYAGVLSFLVRGGDIEVPPGAGAQAKLGADINSSGVVQTTPANSPPAMSQGSTQ